MLSIKDLTKLHKKSFQKETGLFLIEGKNLVDEALNNKLQLDQILATPAFFKNNYPFLQAHNLTKNDFIVISDHNAARLSSTETPQGVFAVVHRQEYSLEDLAQESSIIALDTLKDPGNLGTIIRTADWFGVKGLITTQEGTSIYNDKVMRATMGSLFHLKHSESYDLADDLIVLKEKGFSIVVSSVQDTGKQQLDLTQLPTKWVLVIGNEARGVSPEVLAQADYIFTLPGQGSAESLNAAVSAGIMVYLLTQK